MTTDTIPGGPVNCSALELSTYLQALAEGFLATSCSVTSPSAQSRSTPIASRSYQHGKKTVAFHGSPSLRMSKSSTGDHGEGSSMLSRGVFPASPFPSPANAKEQTMNETSGGKPSESSKKSDHLPSSSKTSQGSSPEDLTLAYVAGLIDGEGCIGIYRSHKRSLQWFYADVTIGMSQKALPLLKMMEETFGGHINQQRKKTLKWESAWKWRIGGVAAFSFLEKVLPYLQLKRAQAETVLALRSTPKDQHPELKRRIHELNRKGPKRMPEGAFAMLVDGEWETGQLLLDGTMERFSGPWPRAGMTRDGIAFRRQALELHTEDGDSGSSLPTPSAQSYGTNQGGAAGRVGPVRASLETMARRGLWPTPDARDSQPEGMEAGKRRLAKYSTIGLQTAVKLWPTPKARDWRSVTGREERNSPDLNVVVAAEPWPTPTVNGNRNRAGLSEKSGDGLQTAVGGSLNPAWVAWLMGWPVGWEELEPMAGFETWLKQDGWWLEEPPGVPRVAVGVKHRVDRLRALGNGQVPLCAARAWEELSP